MQGGCSPDWERCARAPTRLILAVVVWLPWIATAHGAGREPTEYEVKSAFLFHFARLVAWPGWPSPSDPGEAFEIALVGGDPFGDALESTIGESQVQGRPIRIRRVPSVAALPRLPQLLFVGDADEAAARRALAAVRGHPVLTVGEASGFAQRGGMIGFRLTPDGRVTFDVNLARAEESGLRISSQLLRVARVVEARP